MSRTITLLLLACLNAGSGHGMDCSFGQSTNVFEKFINSCPQPLQSKEKSFCCYDLQNEKAYCCDAEEFALKTWLGVFVPVIITAATVIALIVCCISCLCCSCCPWYRRRHQGTVYGKVQAPSVVHVYQQAPAVIPQPTQNLYTANPMNPTEMPQPPPQYSNEMYAKQAPYNPNYPQ